MKKINKYKSYIKLFHVLSVLVEFDCLWLRIIGSNKFDEEIRIFLKTYMSFDLAMSLLSLFEMKTKDLKLLAL